MPLTQHQHNNLPAQPQAGTIIGSSSSLEFFGDLPQDPGFHNEPGPAPVYLPSAYIPNPQMQVDYNQNYSEAGPSQSHSSSTFIPNAQIQPEHKHEQDDPMGWEPGNWGQDEHTSQPSTNSWQYYNVGSMQQEQNSFFQCGIPWKKTLNTLKLVAEMARTGNIFHTTASVLVNGMLSIWDATQHVENPVDKCQSVIRKLLDQPTFNFLHWSQVVKYFNHLIIVVVIIQAVWETLKSSKLIDEMTFNPVICTAITSVKLALFKNKTSVFKKGVAIQNTSLLSTPPFGPTWIHWNGIWHCKGMIKYGNVLSPYDEDEDKDEDDNYVLDLSGRYLCQILSACHGSDEI
ncbi:hypothetical protein PAXRUDRAFT_24598 [Paxillus rubicundulus Ve08.2h10]|uniref:Uncharacterized protein n=1 Tax=Paxillus rubicundulus Ve08.2h10 TaxID=930991 RepID=A0A0D0DHA5_9AGAM|nr:hypothetical protein PAXRUDRAFT_24598 [Paxillus rubicundulus Ve08.2h10]